MQNSKVVMKYIMVVPVTVIVDVVVIDTWNECEGATTEYKENVYE